VGVPIGAAARSFLRVRGLATTVTLADVMTAWLEVVGEAVAAQARPVAMRKSALVVEVSEPAWATELQFQAAAILERLTERLGDRAPREIVVRVSRPGTSRRDGSEAPERGAG
jgi:predicted nucleic acid-binding Zn ribbon protein